MSTEKYDLIIIGSGPGGYVAGIRAGQLGLKTLMIEKDPQYGGTCLHKGCIPAKALLHAGEVFHMVRRAGDFGVEVTGASINIGKVQEYKDRVVNRLAKGVEFLLKKNRVAMLNAVARIKSPTQVEAAGKVYDARVILVATGSIPKSLPNLAFDGDGIISCDYLWSMKAVPKNVLVIGAGAIGVESATTFLRFGSEVTLVELLPQMVPLEDEEIAIELKRQFAKRGVQVLLQSKVTAAAKAKGGYQVAIEGADGKKTEGVFEKILVAVGRGPNTANLGLEGTRVKMERGFIMVNGVMQTDEPSIYAIGDVVPTPALAHIASFEGVTAVEHVAGKNPRLLNYDRTPNCTFCDPQIASVGLTERKAKERGFKVKVSKFSFMGIGMALILGESEGFVKIVANERYGEILGVHIIHPHASYIIGEACAAISAELPAEELARTIHPHPTLSEAIMEAAHGIEGTPIHM